MHVVFQADQKMSTALRRCPRLKASNDDTPRNDTKAELRWNLPNFVLSSQPISRVQGICHPFELLLKRCGVKIVDHLGIGHNES